MMDQLLIKVEVFTNVESVVAVELYQVCDVPFKASAMSYIFLIFFNLDFQNDNALCKKESSLRLALLQKPFEKPNDKIE